MNHWAGLDLQEPVVMGILNVTPDSFSDGGDFITPDAARARAQAICSAGAKILDIGGESTRPGAVLPDIEIEIQRVVPVIHAVKDIAKNSGVKISIDTRRAPVMQAAIDAGAEIINDVSALAFDADALPLVAARGWPVVLCHMRGTPQDMGQHANYKDIGKDVSAELMARVNACLNSGIGHANICLDPGIGFAKDAQHNIDLLQQLNQVTELGFPVLVGASRKRFIGDITGEAIAKDRLGGSIAAALFAAQNGAQIIRAHDVAETVQALRMWAALAPRGV